MNLADWLIAYPTALVMGPTHLEITHLVADSRKVTPGALFVAIDGPKRKSIPHISEAVRAGATVVVTDHPVSLGGHATRIWVADARHALAHLAYFFLGVKIPRLIGVTGTNGKTTTAWLIRAILRAAGRKTGLLGTIEYDCGGAERQQATYTTPDPLTLASLFARMETEGVTDAVMEVSSHALAQQRVACLTFDVGIFTNLTQDHLDYHKTMWDYFCAKRKLFRQTRCAVVNVDDPWTPKIIEAAPQIGFGLERKRAIFATDVRTGSGGTRMTVITPIGPLAIASPLAGRHNVYNLLAAIGAGVALQIPGSAIVAGLGDVACVPGRMERIDLGQDFWVLVDYAHTPDALSHLLTTVASFSPKRILTVFGCGGDRDRGKRMSMGIASAQRSDWTILTSDNPRSEPPDAIIEEIVVGIQMIQTQQGWSAARHEIIPDRREAITKIIEMAQPGDAVVIAGKGHETVQIIGKDIRPFDDRAVAREALSARVSAATRDA